VFYETLVLFYFANASGIEHFNSKLLLFAFSLSCRTALLTGVSMMMNTPRQGLWWSWW